MRDTIERNGRTYRVTIEHDGDMGAPWEEHDGHGVVSEWTRRDKAPGEVVIASDRGSHRFYDVAETTRIAKRDGWGLSDADAAALLARLAQPKRRAVKSVYNVENGIRQDRITEWATVPGRDPSKPLTRGEIIAEAVRRDCDRMRQWCADVWGWCGVIVELLDDDGDGTGETASLWGIESDAGAYLDEVAADLVDEMESPRLAADIAALEASRPDLYEWSAS